MSMEERYDVVIIGSGMGGLLCGALLGKNGYRVAVLEKNSRIGGCLQSYSRDGGVFDTGVHYIGGLAEGQTLNRIFRYVGLMDRIQVKQFGNDGFDVIRFGDISREFVYKQNYEDFIEALAAEFPHEREGITNYCNSIRGLCDRFPLYNLRNGDFMDKIDLLGLNARESIESFVSDPLLRQVLAGNNCLYAGEGDKSPFYIHALILNSYIESAWRCEGGGSQIAGSLADIITELGGRVFRRTEVTRIVVENDRATRVLTSDGREFTADTFISDLHPAVTLSLTQSEGFRKAYVKRIQGLENTISVFILNLVFHEAAFPSINRNIYYYSKAENVWEGIDYNPENWPENYAFFVTAGEDGFARSASVMCYMRFSEFEAWADTFNMVSQPGDRGPGYLEKKEEKAQKIFDLLDQHYPGVRSAVKSYHTLSPLTYRDYTGNPGGSLYGIQRNCNDPIRTYVPARTKVPNLLLTGQNLNLHGVMGVSVSSIITCSELLDIDELLQQIRSC
jgi:all-trans-retinol 13,14-reductase